MKEQVTILDTTYYSPRKLIIIKIIKSDNKELTLALPACDLGKIIPLNRTLSDSLIEKIENHITDFLTKLRGRKIFLEIKSDINVLPESLFAKPKITDVISDELKSNTLGGQDFDRISSSLDNYPWYEVMEYLDAI